MMANTSEKAMLVHGWLLSLIMSACYLPSAVAQRCYNATGNVDSGGSCSFESGDCGYSNIGGDQVVWEMDKYRSNDYMSLKTDGQSGGRAAYLASPLLCATGSELHSLRFKYYINYSNRCKLSAYLVVGAGKTLLWQTSQGTGRGFSSSVSPIFLRCFGHPFQIVFIGEKLTDAPCGSSYDEIDIDDIVYFNDGSDSSIAGTTCNTPSTPTPARTTTTRRTTTAGPPITKYLTTAPESTSSNSPSTKDGSNVGQQHNDDDRGMSSGGIAGLVIFVVILIAAIIGGMWLYRRWKSGKVDKPLQCAVKPSQSMTNRLYDINSHRQGRQGVQNHPDVILQVAADEEGNIYAEPDSRRSSAVYADPDEITTDVTSSRGHQSGEGDDRSAHSQSLYMNVDVRQSAEGYSKLFLDAACGSHGANASSTYDHLSTPQDGDGHKSATLDSHHYNSLGDAGKTSEADSQEESHDFKTAVFPGFRNWESGATNTCQTDKFPLEGHIGKEYSLAQNVTTKGEDGSQPDYSLAQSTAVPFPAQRKRNVNMPKSPVRQQPTTTQACPQHGEEYSLAHNVDAPSTTANGQYYSLAEHNAELLADRSTSCSSQQSSVYPLNQASDGCQEAAQIYYSLANDENHTEQTQSQAPGHQYSLEDQTLGKRSPVHIEEKTVASPHSSSAQNFYLAQHLRALKESRDAKQQAIDQSREGNDYGDPRGTTAGAFGSSQPQAREATAAIDARPIMPGVNDSTCNGHIDAYHHITDKHVYNNVD